MIMIISSIMIMIINSIMIMMKNSQNMRMNITMKKLYQVTMNLMNSKRTLRKVILRKIKHKYCPQMKIPRSSMIIIKMKKREPITNIIMKKLFQAI